MKLVGLIIVSLFVMKTESYQSSNYIRIDDSRFNGTSNEIIYKNRIILASYSTMQFSINGINFDKFQYAIMQVHCLHYNISLTLETSRNGQTHQYGTNLGFLVKSNEPISKRYFRLSNNNYDDVHCLVLFIAYVKSSPRPCTLENTTTMDMQKIKERANMLTVIIPSTNDSAASSCEDSQLIYETYYTYLDIRNFGVDVYFEGIEKMIFNNIFTAYKARNLLNNNSYVLETIPGRGLIINTVVKNDYGGMVFFMPVVTYSCPPNTWSAHCTENDFTRRGISIVLVIHSIVLMLTLMAPDFIESVLSGMLYGGFGTILLIKSYGFEVQIFDYFIVVIIGAFFASAFFGTITLYWGIGRYLTKLTFSIFVIVFCVEIFFSGIVSPILQFIASIILSVALSFTSTTFSSFLGCLILILNFSYLSKFGNLHRFTMNNFLALTTVLSENNSETYFDFIRPNYINYKVTLNFVDVLMIIFYILTSLYLTFRKEIFFFEHPLMLENDNIFVNERIIPDHDCNIPRQRNNEIIVIRGTCAQYYEVLRSRRRLTYGIPIPQRPGSVPTHRERSSSEDDGLYHTPDGSPRVRERSPDQIEEDLMAGVGTLDTSLDFYNPEDMYHIEI